VLLQELLTVPTVMLEVGYKIIVIVLAHITVHQVQLALIVTVLVHVIVVIVLSVMAVVINFKGNYDI
jgi:hypothetical protein